MDMFNFLPGQCAGNPGIILLPASDQTRPSFKLVFFHTISQKLCRIGFNCTEHITAFSKVILKLKFSSLTSIVLGPAENAQSISKANNWSPNPITIDSWAYFCSGMHGRNCTLQVREKCVLVHKHKSAGRFCPKREDVYPGTNQVSKQDDTAVYLISTLK